jgi:hypothetical protein
MKIVISSEIYLKGNCFNTLRSVILSSLSVFILSAFISNNILAATDFRSINSGNWNSTSTWESFNGTSWVAASSTPTNSSGVISIRNGNTVTVSSNVTADEITVDAGGTLTISSGKTLTVANSTSGVDLTVNGTLTIFGTMTNQGSSSTIISGLVILKSGGTNNYAGSSNITINSGGRYRSEDNGFTTAANIWVINSGGVYQHNVDGGSIPQATWNTNSSCEVTGIVSIKPGNVNQSFYNFTWNSTGQTTVVNLSGLLENISGDFYCISTGTGKVRLSQTENYTMNIGGNYYHQGGTLFATTKSTACFINITGNFIQTSGTFAGTDVNQYSGQGSPEMNVYGDFSISSGTFDMSQYTSNTSNKGIMTLNLFGNLIQSGGTITETATNTGEGNIYFTKTGIQYFTKTGGNISNTVHSIINSGSTVDVGVSIFTGSGNFTLLSGGGLNMGSVDGITTASAIGNVQVTGTRSYSSGANYTYNGTLAQVTGNGLPSTIQNLTINNSAGVSLTSSLSVSGSLFLTSGNVTTSANTLTLGTSTATLGSLSRTSGHVVGAFKRWIAATATSNILFPVGTSTDYKGINYSFTTAPAAGGSITVTFDNSYLGAKQLNLIDGADTIQNAGMGLWNTSSANGLSGGVFNIDLTATNLPGVTSYNSLRLISRTNSSSNWATQGSHSAATGSNSTPIVHRTGLTSHVQFGVGSPAANTLPIQLVSFKAFVDGNKVGLSWTTSSEINNEYFTVERSSDGVHFEELLHKSGAGNSTVTLNYYDFDNNPLPGYNYYRLRQTDFDGKSTLSIIRAVNFSQNKMESSSFKITTVGPNPFSNNLTINCMSELEENAEVKVFDINSRLIYSEKINVLPGENTFQINIENNYLPGVYFLNLIHGGNSNSIKLIKQ